MQELLPMMLMEIEWAKKLTVLTQYTNYIAYIQIEDMNIFLY